MKSEEQIAHENSVARSFDILLIAEKFGYTFKPAGRQLVCKESPELIVFRNTNSFYDYYNKKGGTPIDFVMREKECSVKDAIEFINELAGSSYIPEIKPNVKVEQKEREFKLPEKNENHKRVYAYLKLSRGISHEVITFCLHNHLLYESKDKHNAIFVGKDKDGNDKHAFMRGTVTGVQYRGDIYGSDKNYGFVIPGSNDELIVFEAPIDLLSYMTLYPENKSNLLALGMLVDAPIYTFLKENDNVKKVALVLDNDSKAIDATLKISNKLKENGVEVVDNDVSSMLKEQNLKDVNELLCKGNVKDNNMKR